jgi:hypothetical protein
MGVYKPPGNPKNVTPADWSGPPDARDTGGEYPNYNVITKTNSGHVIMTDDTKGSEHVTIQHRSGSMLQLTPDGGISIGAQNGMYQIIFGENRMLITGAQDITVQGGGSLYVKGDYNMTVEGNHNTVVHGDMNLTAKNLNQTIRGNMDTTAKEMSTNIEGSSKITSQGITTIASDGGLALLSTSDSVTLGAKQNLGVYSGNKMMLEAGSSMHMKSIGALNLKTSARLSLKGGSIAADGSDGGANILLASGASADADGAEIKFKKTTSPNRET